MIRIEEITFQTHPEEIIIIGIEHYGIRKNRQVSRKNENDETWTCWRDPDGRREYESNGFRAYIYGRSGPAIRARSRNRVSVLKCMRSRARVGFGCVWVCV